MRWLVVSDLHYALPQFDWLMAAAPGFDLVIFAGDALDAGSIVDFGAQTVVVRKYLERLSAMTRVIFCTGNHDLDARDESGELFPAVALEKRSRVGEFAIADEFREFCAPDIIERMGSGAKLIQEHADTEDIGTPIR
jgi:predicted phosphodiesterase